MLIKTILIVVVVASFIFIDSYAVIADDDLVLIVV